MSHLSRHSSHSSFSPIAIPLHTHASAGLSASPSTASINAPSIAAASVAASQAAPPPPFPFLKLKKSFSIHTNNLLKKLEGDIRRDPSNPQAYLDLAEEYRQLGARYSFLRLLTYGRTYFPHVLEFKELLYAHHPSLPRTPPPKEPEIMMTRNKEYDYKWRHKEKYMFPKEIYKLDTSIPPISRQYRHAYLHFLSQLHDSAPHRVQPTVARSNIALVIPPKWNNANHTNNDGAPSTLQWQPAEEVPVLFQQSNLPPKSIVLEEKEAERDRETRDLIAQRDAQLEEMMLLQEKEQFEKEKLRAARDEQKIKAKAAQLVAERERELSAAEAKREQERQKAYEEAKERQLQEQLDEIERMEEEEREREAQAREQQAALERARQQERREREQRAHEAAMQAEQERINAEKQAEQQRLEKMKKERDEAALKAAAEQERFQREADAQKAALEAERERTRQQVAAEKARLDAEREKTKRETEAAKAALEAERAKAQADAEAERARQAAEMAAAQRELDAERARLAAETARARAEADAEKARLEKERELARKQAEADKAKLEREKEAARQQAERDKAALLAQQEAARLAAEKEKAELAAVKQKLLEAEMTQRANSSVPIDEAAVRDASFEAARQSESDKQKAAATALASSRPPPSAPVRVPTPTQPTYAETEDTQDVDIAGPLYFKLNLRVSYFDPTPLMQHWSAHNRNYGLCVEFLGPPWDKATGQVKPNFSPNDWLLVSSTELIHPAANASFHTVLLSDLDWCMSNDAAPVMIRCVAVCGKDRENMGEITTTVDQLFELFETNVAEQRQLSMIHSDGKSHVQLSLHQLSRYIQTLNNSWFSHVQDSITILNSVMSCIHLVGRDISWKSSAQSIRFKLFHFHADQWASQKSMLLDFQKANPHIDNGKLAIFLSQYDAPTYWHLLYTSELQSSSNINFHPVTKSLKNLAHSALECPLLIALLDQNDVEIARLRTNYRQLIRYIIKPNQIVNGNEPFCFPITILPPSTAQLSSTLVSPSHSSSTQVNTSTAIITTTSTTSTITISTKPSPLQTGYFYLCDAALYVAVDPTQVPGTPRLGTPVAEEI